MSKKPISQRSVINNYDVNIPDLEPGSESSDEEEEFEPIKMSFVTTPRAAINYIRYMNEKRYKKKLDSYGFKRLKDATGYGFCKKFSKTPAFMEKISDIGTSYVLGEWNFFFKDKLILKTSISNRSKYEYKEKKTPSEKRKTDKNRGDKLNPTSKEKGSLTPSDKSSSDTPNNNKKDEGNINSDNNNDKGNDKKNNGNNSNKVNSGSNSIDNNPVPKNTKATSKKYKVKDLKRLKESKHYTDSFLDIAENHFTRSAEWLFTMGISPYKVTYNQHGFISGTVIPRFTDGTIFMRFNEVTEKTDYLYGWDKNKITKRRADLYRKKGYGEIDGHLIDWGMLFHIHSTLCPSHHPKIHSIVSSLLPHYNKYKVASDREDSIDKRFEDYDKVMINLEAPSIDEVINSRTLNTQYGDADSFKNFNETSRQCDSDDDDDDIDSQIGKASGSDVDSEDDKTYKAHPLNIDSKMSDYAKPKVDKSTKTLVAPKGYGLRMLQPTKQIRNSLLLKKTYDELVKMIIKHPFMYLDKLSTNYNTASVLLIEQEIITSEVGFKNMFTTFSKELLWSMLEPGITHYLESITKGYNNGTGNLTKSQVVGEILDIDVTHFTVDFPSTIKTHKLLEVATKIKNPNLEDPVRLK